MKSEFHIFIVLAGKKLRELCLGSAFIALAFAQQFSMAFFLRSSLVALGRDGMIVAFHPGQYGLAFSVLLLGVFLLLYAALEPAKERETGTLETLFYGPVTARVYVLSLSAALLGAAVLSCAMLLCGLFVGSFLIGYDVPAEVFVLFLLTSAFLFSVTSFGLFVSLFFAQFRSTVIFAVIFLTLSFSFFAANYYLSHADVSGSFAFVYLRQGISIADGIFRYAFPFGLFLGDLVGLIEYGSIPAAHTVWYPLYGSIALFFSVASLKRRGVQAR